MFLLTSNPNFDATTLDAAVNKENLNYILKFGLFLSIALLIYQFLLNF